MLLVATFIWGTGFVGVQAALDFGLGPFQLLAGRFTLAALVFDLLFLKKIPTIRKEVILPGLVLAGCMFFGFVLQTLGQQQSTPSVCAFVTASYVLMTPFIDWPLTRKKPGPGLLVCAAVTLAGVALISVNEAFQINFGALLTLGCAVFFALQVSCTSAFTKARDPIALTIVMLNANMLLADIALLLADRNLPAALPLEAVWVLVYLAVVGTVVAFLLQNIGQKYITGGRAAIIFSMEAVFGALLSALFYKEVLSPRMLLGCGLIFAAMIFSNLDLRRLVYGRNHEKEKG
jgi:drug/metabolite transporter (DMT)-like permease